MPLPSLVTQTPTLQTARILAGLFLDTATHLALASFLGDLANSALLQTLHAMLNTPHCMNLRMKPSFYNSSWTASGSPAEEARLSIAITMPPPDLRKTKSFTLR